MTDTQREEPFDGVCPEQHPETYKEFLKSYCFKQREGEILIFITGDNSKAFCSNCYRPEIRNRENGITRHTNWHKIGISPSYVRCHICRRTIISKRLIIDCGICTEAFLGVITYVSIKKRQNGKH